MGNVLFGVFFIAFGIILAVFYKRCARGTIAFHFYIKYTENKKRFVEIGFLVTGIIFIFAGILMFLQPSLFKMY